MTASKVSYNYPEYDFLDFLYLNGYLTERPTESLPEAPDRTPFENRIRSIAVKLNCQRRKPKELIDPFYRTNFRWVFAVDDITPGSRILGAALLRSPDGIESVYDLLYFETEEDVEEETLQSLWKHVLFAMGADEDGIESTDIKERMKGCNATLLGFLAE